MPPVVFPLQYLPLINHRRLGPISYRSWMIATGEAKPREGEEIHDAAAIEVALMEEELPVLVERREQFETLQSALTSIRNVCVDQLGADRAAKLERLPTLAEKIRALLESVVARRDPNLATAPATGAHAETAASIPSSVPAGAVTSTRDVIDSLAAIADYFARCEPSNPALLLVRQAKQLMGKSFLDVMRVLVPNQMDQAAVRIGKDQIFDLPIERLSEFAEVAAASQDDPATPEEPPPDSETPSDSAPQGGASAASTAPRRIEVRSRSDATRLLDQIGSFYRVAEPSSPVPFLTDRARSFAERDFLSLLKEFLPPDTLKGPTPGA
jgi:type VI secretion system protein ImpA